jgi:uncharacterized membrane protein YjgN (DUF898 family)
MAPGALHVTIHVPTAVVAESVTAAASGAPRRAPLELRRPFDWNGNEAHLRRLIWRNAILSLVTVGVYAIWAKVAWRQALWRSLRFQGKRLAFTGTVREAMIPVLVAAAVIVAAIAAIVIMKWLGTPRPPVPRRSLRLFAAIPAIFLLGLAAWRARSYLVSRTEIDGLAGRLEGSPLGYAFTHFATAFLTPLTFGLIIPWRQAWLQRRLVGGMVLGPHRVACRGIDARRLLGRLAAAFAAGAAVYLAAVLAVAFSPLAPKLIEAHGNGTLPALSASEVALLAGVGLIAGLAMAAAGAWYRIGMLRLLAAATSIDGHVLRLDVATSDFVRTAVVNWLMRLGSLGLLGCLAELRMVRLLVERLSFEQSHTCD